MEQLPRPRIFLIDGYAVIYRAFFAMIARPLTTAHGENTSAPWGVANFLLRLRDQYKPEYVVWVNDAGSSFRKDTYPEYKATREKLDDELQDVLDRSMERTTLEACRPLSPDSTSYSTSCPSARVLKPSI